MFMRDIDTVEVRSISLSFFLSLSLSSSSFRLSLCRFVWGVFTALSEGWIPSFCKFISRDHDSDRIGLRTFPVPLCFFFIMLFLFRCKWRLSSQICASLALYSLRLAVRSALKQAVTLAAAGTRTIKELSHVPYRALLDPHRFWASSPLRYHPISPAACAAVDEFWRTNTVECKTTAGV